MYVEKDVKLKKPPVRTYIYIYIYIYIWIWSALGARDRTRMLIYISKWALNLDFAVDRILNT